MEVKILRVTIGEEIRESRLRKGWSQEDLSAESGLSVTTISNYETGKHKPTVGNLKKISNVLGVTFEVGKKRETGGSETLGLERRLIEAERREIEAQRKVLELERRLAAFQKGQDEFLEGFLEMLPTEKQLLEASGGKAPIQKLLMARLGDSIRAIRARGSNVVEVHVPGLMDFISRPDPEIVKEIEALKQQVAREQNLRSETEAKRTLKRENVTTLFQGSRAPDRQAAQDANPDDVDPAEVHKKTAEELERHKKAGLE